MFRVPGTCPILYSTINYDVQISYLKKQECLLEFIRITLLKCSLFTMPCLEYLGHALLCVVLSIMMCRYNGGEGYVPGSMFRKFDRRQGTAYVKNVS